MNYQDMLKLLAEKKLAQKNSDNDYTDNNQVNNTVDDSQPMEPEKPSQDDDSDDVMTAQNNRQPDSTGTLPDSGQDVQLIQGLGIIDKVNMKRQGLDPWNPDDVKKYIRSRNS